jgi:two-component system response regulator AtoC
MRDPAVLAMYRIVERVAPSELSILLLGETGVGKEVVADAIHRASSRASGPFLRLNCAALSEGLLESELFGYERGAFTGAADRKLGLLETASGGTVLLDEVGELPLTTQVKLLRVIEQRELTRVGGLDVIPVNVRFVSATNRDLEAAVATGRFRGDLYYRLNGLTLRVPPLRERRSEIEPLARLFLAAAATRGGRRLGLSPEALRRLVDHRWPGNARELKQVMERASLLSPTEVVDEASLQLAAPEPGRGARAGADAATVGLAGSRESTELAELLHALEVCAGNQSRAARILNISRGTLLARLDKYGVRRPRK